MTEMTLRRISITTNTMNPMAMVLPIRGEMETRGAPADQMAAIVGMVSQNAVRVALGEIGTHGASSLILLGGFLAEPGFRAAIEASPFFQRFPVPIAEMPQYAVVRGALAAARRRREQP